MGIIEEHAKLQRSFDQLIAERDKLREGIATFVALCGQITTMHQRLEDSCNEMGKMYASIKAMSEINKFTRAIRQNAGSDE